MDLVLIVNRPDDVICLVNFTTQSFTYTAVRDVQENHVLIFQAIHIDVSKMFVCCSYCNSFNVLC